jgi:hypothetical protein
MLSWMPQPGAEAWLDLFEQVADGMAGEPELEAGLSQWTKPGKGAALGKSTYWALAAFRVLRSGHVDGAAWAAARAIAWHAVGDGKDQNQRYVHAPGWGWLEAPPRLPHEDPRGVTAGENERRAQCHCFRDIFGNPFAEQPTLERSWLRWNDGTIPKLAEGIYRDRAFEQTPVLADALEDAGCTNADILTHCRSGGDHVRGCWLIDAILELTQGPLT